MKKDQKAGAEMKKDEKANAEMKKDENACAEMKKDQKAGADLKMVITPVPGEVWVFVQEDRPRKMDELNIVSSTAADSQSMGPVIRKMNEVDIIASSVKNAAQISGFVADGLEHGWKKAFSEVGRSTRLVDKDRDQLYENANLLTRTFEINEKMLAEFAEVKGQLKEIAAAQKRRGSFGPKTGLKKGKGDVNTENGGENGGDANNNGNGSGGDAGSNGGGGGRV